MKNINTEEQFIFGVRHIAYNAALRNRREAMGFFQKELSVALGFHPQTISRIEGMRMKPTESQKKKICDFIGCDIKAIFPKWMDAFVLEKSSFRTEHIITERLLPEVIGKFLPSGNMEDTEEKIDQDILHDKVKGLLNTLSDREAKIIRERFGIDTPVTEEEKKRLDYRSNAKEPKTLEEVGSEFGVTRDRIRQIEARALRKLRHHTRSDKLKPFLV